MPIDVMLTLALAAAVAAAVIAYLLRLLARSGSDLEPEPARVEALVRAAPYARLEASMTRQPTRAASRSAGVSLPRSAAWSQPPRRVAAEARAAAGARSARSS